MAVVQVAAMITAAADARRRSSALADCAGWIDALGVRGLDRQRARSSTARRG